MDVRFGGVLFVYLKRKGSYLVGCEISFFYGFCIDKVNRVGWMSLGESYFFFCFSGFIEFYEVFLLNDW